MITENTKKTIIGIIAGILAVAVSFGFFTPEQAEGVKDATTGLMENIGGLILGAVSLWGVITGKTGE